MYVSQFHSNVFICSFSSLISYTYLEKGENKKEILCERHMHIEDRKEKFKTLTQVTKKQF